MKHRILAAVFGMTLFIGIFSGAQAQMVQIASCMEGGCACHMPGLTISDVEMTLGTTAPDGAEDMTLVFTEEGFSWRSQTPAQIDASFGGAGSCPILLDWPIFPEDGMWRITTGTTDTSACPLFSMTGQAVPGQMNSETRQIKWGGMFSPSKLMPEAKGLVKWTYAGGESWRGVVANERLSSGSGATGASVIWHLTVRSPTEIIGTSVFDYDISSSIADAAAQAILQNMQCRTVTPFTARKVG